MIDNSSNLAERVRALRESRGWSQQHLAELLNTEQPRICEIETGVVKTPRLTTLIDLARVLGVGLGELCGENVAAPTLDQIPP